MMMMNRGVLYCIGLSLVIAVLFASNLLLGSVSIPAEDIVLEPVAGVCVDSC